ncbi:arf-GAP with Rho-GAP domain, ANK repeat and PH domain-containing protein 2 isoform X1 [Callorhinchus milii]|uniref:arf-GAP with Rho-GAP domain, ANK repeat and PH domain-containing protein 2 isoform X1 n=1 Tax=Callorhinchus milii TaxID=7868 RepID=UPI001C3F8EB5|nr:arf-GAP with Rho-GAP domain, ANK repeat and PH domain-containing protein 2 isoform X1 [Callorhinchus milii]XP_007887278.2 arf-GAP with Rho-GAP domain, ANK repeat and PH domain-containing protein 2 isoform X1 [Callorhinchus milii]XP_042197203.1 arf-GAP with Rho-GAP domain, ANK repeat and PH domain-containing protein 2 isoform X1 [Callorhinchus milii]
MSSSSEAGRDIADWLTGIHLEQYTIHFKESGYCTVGACEHVNNETLLELGIAPTGHRKRILRQLFCEFPPMQDEAVGSQALDKQENKGNKRDSDNQGVALRSPPAIEEIEKSTPVSKPRRIYAKSGLTSDRPDPAHSDGCVISKRNTFQPPQVAQVEGQQKCSHGKGLKLHIPEPEDSSFSSCEQQGDVKKDNPADGRPPLPPRVNQGTPPLPFTGDKAQLPSASADSSDCTSTKETSVEADQTPTSPFFEFRGEMRANALYDGIQIVPDQTLMGTSRESDLRNRPPAELPSLCAAQAVPLCAADNSSLLKRRNFNLSNVSKTCDVPKIPLSYDDENRPSPISPYGETFLYQHPEDSEDLNKVALYITETSTRAKNEEMGTNIDSRNHDQTKLCADHDKQKSSHLGGCSTKKDSKTEHSTVDNSVWKLRSEYTTTAEVYESVQATSTSNFAYSEGHPMQFDLGRRSLNSDSDIHSDVEISPYACFYGAAKSTKEGWLDKLSPQGNCMFQKRWVKFDGDNLAYYNNEKEMYSKGIIPASSIITVRGIGDSKFEVLTSNRTFTFRVEKEGERDDWINKLLNAVKSQSNTFPHLGSRSNVSFEKSGYLELKGYKARIFIALKGVKVWIYKNEQDFKSGVGITTVDTNVATVKDVDRKGFELSTPFRNFSFTAESEREKQDWIETLEGSIAESLSDYEVAEKIWFNESNRSCADCRSLDPEWASINLCVVICKKCAGQHRSLGSNISKVRSLKLDISIWSNELVELFIVVGNKNANSFWTANLKAEEELDMDALPDRRLEFITQKYKERKFRKIPLTFLTQEELNKSLCQAVVKQDVLETMSLVFSGADAMCATGDATHCTPYLLAQKAGQRLQMEFLFHNKLSVIPKIDSPSEAAVHSQTSCSTFLCGFLYKAINTTKTVSEKRLKEEFNKRWCTLEGGFLSYYESDKSATPNGRIDISEVVCLGVNKPDLTWGTGVSYTFEMYLLSECLFSFGTDSAETLKDWTRAICKCFIPAVVENLLKKDYELIGRLYYKDVHNLERWSAGWFTLEKSKLCFCPEQDGAEEDSVYLKRLQELTVTTQLEHNEKKDVLLLVEKGRTLYMHGHTKLDFTVWHMAIKKAAGTDGNALRDQQLSKNDIPIIVDSCIAFVTQYGLNCEGMYRKNGTPSRVSQLLDQFRKDARNVKLRAGEHQLGDVADVLKRFLFEMDDALLTKELYPYWLSALDVQDEKERLEKYRMLIQTLPRVNRVTLAALIGHLYRVQKCSEMNQMSTQSLSQVLSSYLFQTEGQNKQEENVTEDLINLYVRLFDVNEDQVKQMDIENSYIMTWKDTQIPQTVDLIIEVYLEKKEPDSSYMLRVSPTMTAEELTHSVLEMKNVISDKKDVWVTFEVIENGDLERPLHHKENVLDQVLQWSLLSEPESAYLIVKQFQAAKAIKTYLAKNMKEPGKAGNLKWREEPSKLLSGNKFQDRYCVLKDEKLLLYKDMKSNKPEREVLIKSLKFYLGLKRRLKSPCSLGFTLYAEKQQWYLCCDKEETYTGWLASLLIAQHEGDLWPALGKIPITSLMLNAKLCSKSLTPIQKKAETRKTERPQDYGKLKLNHVLRQTFREDTLGRSSHMAACLESSAVSPATGQQPTRLALYAGQTDFLHSSAKSKHGRAPPVRGRPEVISNKTVLEADPRLHSKLMQELNSVFLKKKITGEE